MGDRISYLYSVGNDGIERWCRRGRRPEGLEVTGKPGCMSTEAVGMEGGR